MAPRIGGEEALNGARLFHASQPLNETGPTDRVRRPGDERAPRRRGTHHFEAPVGGRGGAAHIDGNLWISGQKYINDFKHLN